MARAARGGTPVIEQKKRKNLDLDLRDNYGVISLGCAEIEGGLTIARNN